MKEKVNAIANSLRFSLALRESNLNRDKEQSQNMLLNQSSFERSEFNAQEFSMLDNSTAKKSKDSSEEKRKMTD